jgi:hypothetical protein
MMHIDDSQIYKGMKFLFLNFSYKVDITNPTPLKNNLVPEICKDRDVKSFIYSLTFNF